MKKLLLFLLLMLLLSGCRGHTPEAAPSTEPPPSTTGSTASIPRDARPLALGRIQDDTYTNTYAGFSCRFGHGWTLWGPESLQELSDEISWALSETELAQALAQYNQFIDFMAENSHLGAQVSVIYQAVDPSQKLSYQLLTQEEVVRRTLEQKELLAETYTRMGLQVASMEQTTAWFLGCEQTGILTILELPEGKLYTLQLMDYSLGDYAIVLTVSASQPEQCHQLLAEFIPE